MNTAEHLTAARDHLLEAGWVQGRYFDIVADTLAWPPGALNCPCCVRGALAVALAKDRGTRRGLFINNAVEDAYSCPAALALGDVVGDRFLGAWNDTAGRTFGDVIAALNEAIARVS